MDSSLRKDQFKLGILWVESEGGVGVSMDFVDSNGLFQQPGTGHSREHLIGGTDSDHFANGFCGLVS